MHWYLIHTKPRQERCALENLERQGYACYLPMAGEWRLRTERWERVDAPLFARYLFIQLDMSLTAKSWAPIRSTRGVSRLVAFGTTPAVVNDELLEQIRLVEAESRALLSPVFAAGDRVKVVGGPFAGLQGLLKELDGERRAMVLIEMMSRPMLLKVEPAQLRRAG